MPATPDRGPPEGSIASGQRTVTIGWLMERVRRVVTGLASLTAAQVTAWLRKRQAGYKTPKVIEFRAELPREDSGKMFKRQLRDPYWETAGRRI